MNKGGRQDARMLECKDGRMQEHPQQICPSLVASEHVLTASPLHHRLSQAPAICLGQLTAYFRKPKSPFLLVSAHGHWYAKTHCEC